MIHPEDGKITLERVQEAMAEFEAEMMDAELNIFLSDSWPVYKILKGGAAIISFEKASPDGTTHQAFYAVDKKALSFNFAPDLPRRFGVGIFTED